MSPVNDTLRIGPAENAFAQIVWDHAPVSSGELVKICKERLLWAKSTTYTVLRRLCEKGIFRNEDGMVAVLISREAFQEAQSELVVAESFRGSRPAFIAAFTARKKLSQEEIEQIRRMIEDAGEESPKGGRS